MLNVPLRNKNKSKQFTKKIKLTRMTNVHVNKMENICSKFSAAKAPGHDNIAMHVKK